MNENDKDKKGMHPATYMPLGIGVGIAIGAALGAAMDNIGVGIALGVAIGAGIGTAFSGMNTAKQEEGQENKEQ